MFVTASSPDKHRSETRTRGRPKKKTDSLSGGYKMVRTLSSCLFSIALVYSVDLAILKSPAQAAVSETIPQAVASDAISDFSAQRGQGNRRPSAGRPGRRPSASHRPGRRPGARPPVAGHRPWARPRRYSWRPGGAIAAGAALGFVAAANAARWGGRPPRPDLCWYYTNRSRTQGFWDLCP